MSDNKDRRGDKAISYPDLPDMDSTVRLDFGGNQNVVSTSSLNDISPDDFDKTIDGLLGMEEILEGEGKTDTSDVPTISFSSDDYDFNELDAGIDALSEEPPGSDGNATEELTDLPDISFDTDDSENEFLASSEREFDDWPLIEKEEKTGDASGTDDSFNLPEEMGAFESDRNEEKAPVIELTKEMLHESEASVAAGTDELPDSGETSEKSGMEGIAETPELTTTETNILAGATAAIKEIGEEEKQPYAAAATAGSAAYASAAPLPVEQHTGSNVFPALLGILGIAAGGFGAWMAFDAGNRVANLEMQLRNLESEKTAATNKQSIIDMQQRLTKIERRLTGTPTIEAAAPLGAVVPPPETATAEATASDEAESEAAITGEKSAKPPVHAITPQTEITAMQAETDDWVVNLSSHAKEALARSEQARLQKAGIHAEIHTATIKNKTWYRIQVTGFATKNEAKERLREIEQRSDIKGAWIGKR